MTNGIDLCKAGDGYEIVLNSPARRNALDAGMWEALTSILSDVAARNPSHLVLRGSGSNFCAGGDLKAMRSELAADRGPEEFRDRIHRCVQQLYDFPAPTVASIRGAAIGGGLELALACDLRVVTRDVLFRMPAARFGMVMALTELHRLASVVGWSWARAIVLTGMDVDAELAQRIGLAHIVAEEEQLGVATQRLVDMLTRMEPIAVQWSRMGLEALLTKVVPDDFRNFETECFRRAAFWDRIGET